MGRREGIVPSLFSMPQTHFSFRLLGGFEVLRNGRRLTGLCRGKPGALLAYLAVESAQTHTRTALAGLLWPERDEEHARQSLRQALTALRGALGDESGPQPLLAVSRETIGFSRGRHDIDIAALDVAEPAECPTAGSRPRAKCRQCHLVAAGHYRGPFLAGMSVPDAPEFESWLELKRERFERRASEMFGHLAACHEQSGEYEQALRYARAQLQVEPWHEEAHRQVIRVLALGGARNAALAHYRRMRYLLTEELGVEPEESSRVLYEAIRVGRLKAPGVMPGQGAGRPSPWEARVCTAAPRGRAGERRALTVLSAELRCGPDAEPEELYQRWRRIAEVGSELVRRHGGVVCPGGNLDLTAYFGYPESCDRAALRAVKAALSLRAIPGEIRPRVRVHTGTVFVPPRLRGACDPDFEVIGPTPRLARSLHAASPEIDVAISQATFAAVRAAVHCRVLPSHRFQDATQPMPIFEVMRLRAAAAGRRPGSR